MNELSPEIVYPKKDNNSMDSLPMEEEPLRAIFSRMSSDMEVELTREKFYRVRSEPYHDYSTTPKVAELQVYRNIREMNSFLYNERIEQKRLWQVTGGGVMLLFDELSDCERENEINPFGLARQSYLLGMKTTISFNLEMPTMDYDIDPVDGTYQLRCGDAVIPIKQPFAIRYLPNRSLYSYDFEVEISYGNTKSGNHKELIRKFLELEQKATRGLLSDDEAKVWEKICGIVDQDKLYLIRERKNPNRYMAQIIEDDQGRRKVKLLTGLEFNLSDSAITALKFLDKGDWFEAGMIMNSDRKIIEIQNVNLRPEPYTPTDEEIYEFFNSKQTD